jgi:hypothetical protein
MFVTRQMERDRAWCSGGFTGEVGKSSPYTAFGRTALLDAPANTLGTGQTTISEG